MVTTVHAAFDIRIFHKQAKSLLEAGYVVTLIAPHDRDEIVEGVRILALQPSRNRLQRMLVGGWRAFRLARRQRADVYHFHDPELLWIGLLLKGSTAGRIIYDVHEDVPQQILNKHWIQSWLRKPMAVAFSLIERLLMRACDAVIPVTEAIAVKMRHPVVQVIHSYPYLAMFRERQTSAFVQDESTRRILYIGGIDEKRGIHEMLEAMKYLGDQAPVQLELIGGFSSRQLESKISPSFADSWIDYQGVLPWHESWQRADGALAGLLLYHPAPNHCEAMPNKLLEYIAAGIPVIGSNFPLWREIVEGNRCGITVNPLDPRAIAAAIQHLLRNETEAEEMGRRGRRAVEEFYNWESESEKLIALYEKMLSGD